jgi:protein-disulfide isomerase
MLPFVLALAVAAPFAARAADETVATVGTVTIKRDDLEKRVRPRLVEIENERYEALREGLDEMVGEELMKQEAKARNVSMADMEKIVSEGPPPTDADVQKVYDENKAALNNQPLDAVKPRIVEYLKAQQVEERKQGLIAELKKKYPTKVALRPPVVAVETAGRPEKGNPKAPVTIVEFSDYECPFCKRAEPTVERVLKEYPDKVRVVFRDFPLDFHPNARPAAEAAKCANLQGKFWPYHEKLFAAKDLTPATLKSIAGEVGLDAAKFDECVAKQATKAAVEEDIKDAAEAGVTGTPAFFVNGRMLSGAQPFEKFKEVIDEELSRQGSPAS